MKKLLCLILILTISVPALSGCRRGDRGGEASEPSPSPSAAPTGPGYTIVSDDDQPSVPDPLATLTPQQRAAITVGANSGDVIDEDIVPPGGEIEQAVQADVNPAATPGVNSFDAYDESTEIRQDAPVPINAANFQYSAVTDQNVDFTFNYPSEWENVPGTFTVCYRQKVQKGQFPARVAVSRKKLVHTPDDIVMNEQMTSYMKAISKQYDEKTFQLGTPNHDETFIRRKAISNTYLAYWGNVEVKGYVIGVAVDRTLYVLHFCAPYADYAQLEGALQYMVNSVMLYEDPKDKKKKR